MKKIEAPTLADAYEKAALELECSITELQYEVIQHPSSGILGLFKKSAIIVAECKRSGSETRSVDDVAQAIAAEEIIEDILEEDKILEEIIEDERSSEYEDRRDDTPKESAEKAQPKKQAAEKRDQPERVKNRLDKELTQRDDAVLDSFFETKETIVEQRPENNNLELAEKIEAELAELMAHS